MVPAFFEEGGEILEVADEYWDGDVVEGERHDEKISRTID